MARRVSKLKTRRRGVVRPRDSLTEGVRLERHLSRIFSSLATLLLRHGYGYGRVSRLAKAAFVEAAISLSENRKSKTNIARIATITGLTRIEVSRFVRRSHSESAMGDSKLNRATRVADGWKIDSRFSNGRNRPKALSLSSAQGGFGHLVKEYSGDIPVRAMLTEMIRLGMVQLKDKSSVVLIRQRPLVSRSTVNTVRAISPWLNVLANPSDDPADSNLSSTTEQLRVYFDSFPQVLAAARELENRRQSFADGIRHLGTRSKVTGKHVLKVYIAIAAVHPNRLTIKESKNGRKNNEV